MNELMNIISSPEFGEVRTVLRDGEPWFVAKDVCEVLDIANSRDAVAKLDADERADVGISDTSSNGVTQKREMNVVNEFGLYQLILRSNKPEAKRFKRWITHDVLPSIRKQGYYSTIKDEDLIAIISKRRREDATYLLEGLADERDKLNAERYEQLKVIWNTRRFDLTLEQVDEMIDEIWRGDAVGAEKAKEHYRELYFSKLGLSHIYGRWKDPRKPKRRIFARERELIEAYEHIAMRDAVEAARKKEFTLPECETRMDELNKMDQITLQSILKIAGLRSEIDRLQTENDRLKNMVSAAAN